MNNKFKNQKGVTLFLSLLVLGILFSIGFALSSSLVNQIAVIRGIGNSVVAFYAADTGIEKALLKRGSPADIPETILDNNATYEVESSPAGCGVFSNYCFQSTGSFQEVQRAIEVKN